MQQLRSSRATMRQNSAVGGHAPLYGPYRTASPRPTRQLRPADDWHACRRGRRIRCHCRPCVGRRAHGGEPVVARRHPTTLFDPVEEPLDLPCCAVEIRRTGLGSCRTPTPWPVPWCGASHHGRALAIINGEHGQPG